MLKIAEYSKKLRGAAQDAPIRTELAKEAGMVRLGIKKNVDDRAVIARI